MGAVPCPVCGGPVGRHCKTTAAACTWDQCSRCAATVDRVTTRHTHPLQTCMTCGPTPKAASAAEND